MRIYPSPTQKASNPGFFPDSDRSLWDRSGSGPLGIWFHLVDTSVGHTSSHCERGTGPGVDRQVSLDLGSRVSGLNLNLFLGPPAQLEDLLWPWGAAPSRLSWPGHPMELLAHQHRAPHAAHARRRGTERHAGDRGAGHPQNARGAGVPQTWGPGHGRMSDRTMDGCSWFSYVTRNKSRAGSESRKRWIMINYDIVYIN